MKLGKKLIIHKFSKNNNNKLRTKSKPMLGPIRFIFPHTAYYFNLFYLQGQDLNLVPTFCLFLKHIIKTTYYGGFNYV